MPDEGYITPGRAARICAERDAALSELTTLRAKAEGLDRLDGLLRDGWQLTAAWVELGVVSLRFMHEDTLKSFEVDGPSLVEAINALPIGSEGS